MIKRFFSTIRSWFLESDKNQSVETEPVATGSKRNRINDLEDELPIKKTKNEGSDQINVINSMHSIVDLTTDENEEIKKSKNIPDKLKSMNRSKQIIRRSLKQLQEPKPGISFNAYAVEKNFAKSPSGNLRSSQVINIDSDNEDKYQKDRFSKLSVKVRTLRGSSKVKRLQKNMNSTNYRNSKNVEMYKRLSREAYSQLLTQICCAPIPKSTNTSLRNVSIDLTKSDKEDESDDDVEVVSCSSSRRQSNRLIEKANRSKTVESFIDLTSPELPRRQLNRLTDVVQLDDSSDENSDNAKTSTNVQPVNSLQHFRKHELAQDDFLQKLIDKYAKRRNSYDAELKKVQSEQELFKSITEDHHQKYVDRLMRHLKITESVLEDELEEETKFPIFTTDMLNLISNSLNGKLSKTEVLVKNFDYELTRQDLLTLNPLQWLNDQVINLYMEMIKDRGKNGGKYIKVHTFSTFFYERVSSGGQTAVKRWTRKIDIFAYEMILIPIHLGIHWCLASIDFKKKQIRYYDSMGNKNPSCLQNLLQYLIDEMKDKKNTNFDKTEWILESTLTNVPQQNNGSDCGVFSCTFAEFLSRRSPLTFSQSDMPYLRKKMVYELVSRKMLL